MQAVEQPSTHRLPDHRATCNNEFTLMMRLPYPTPIPLPVLTCVHPQPKFRRIVKQMKLCEAQFYFLVFFRPPSLYAILMLMPEASI